MKKKINAVIVVEGKSDVQFLETFIDSEFVITNGSDVPRETINYLKSLSTIKKIIVLTDPDSPGKRIRDLLNKEIPSLLHAYVDKEQSIKKNKVGVAESNKDHILKALDNLVDESEFKNGSLTMLDLFNLHLIGSKESSKLRNKVMQKLGLGFGNGKTLLKRLNSLQINYDKLVKIIEEEK